jgi:ribosome-associated translation inhibitor RaiA
VNIEPIFEPTGYYDIPHMPVREMITLIREMLAIKPADGPVELDQVADELERQADKAQARLDFLGEAHDEEVEAGEVFFEDWTDTLAHLVQTSLSSWTLWEQPILERILAKDAELQSQLPHKRELAARARAVVGSMFGEDGRDFFRLGYERRFRALSAMLRTLAKDDLGGNFKELMREPLASTVEALSAGYELQVEEHILVRDEASSLGSYRVALRWALAVYCGELADMADRHSQESCDKVNAALEPLERAYKAHKERQRKQAEERRAQQKRRDPGEG